MGWNTPQTAVVAGILTASFWNLNVRDNFRALGISTIQNREIIEGVSPGVIRLVDSASLRAVPGEIVWYPGDAAPENYLICDGTLVDRTTYADLFAAIGITFGSGAEYLLHQCGQFVSGRLILAGGLHRLGIDARRFLAFLGGGWERSLYNRTKL